MVDSQEKLTVLAVVDAYVDAENVHDIDAMLTLLADYAVFKVVPPPRGSSGVFTGKDQIRGLFQSLFDDNLRVELGKPLQVEGDKAKEGPGGKVFLDSHKPLGVYPILGTAEWVIRNGKIISETFTWSQDSVAKLQSADPLR